MDSLFIESLKQKARARRARVGLGIWNADAALIASLQSAAEYADLLLVGDPGCDCDLDCFISQEPWKDLVRLLAAGEIEGAVRGNLPAGRTMGALSEQFGIRVRRLALLELPGWAFMLGPVGIDEGESMADRLELLLGGARFLKGLGIKANSAVLSGGRKEDRGRSERVDR
ncbi:MAG TPA: methyltransferase, partial [Methanothrix sp.]|nr:methyltransferase [Methanothrix sp.]